MIANFIVHSVLYSTVTRWQFGVAHWNALFLMPCFELHHLVGLRNVCHIEMQYIANRKVNYDVSSIVMLAILVLLSVKVRLQCFMLSYALLNLMCLITPDLEINTLLS